MKIVLNPLRFGICIALLLSISCTKRGHFEVPCKIEKITERYHFYPEDPFTITTATFSYNFWGDPTTIEMNPASTGKPNYYFNYDSKRRLTSHYGQYDGGWYDFYTRYTYNNNHFIEQDTTWYSGNNINDLSSFYQWSVSKYTFDSKGRVSKVETKYNLDPSQTWQVKTFSYDANGNKIRGDGAVYDDKTNFLRTSLVLAFMMRDYSKNNPVVADSYNAKGLPTSNSPEWRTEGQLMFMNMMAHQLEYTCDDHDSHGKLD